MFTANDLFSDSQGRYHSELKHLVNSEGGKGGQKILKGNIQSANKFAIFMLKLSNLG